MTFSDTKGLKRLSRVSGWIKRFFTIGEQGENESISTQKIKQRDKRIINLNDSENLGGGGARNHNLYH